MDTNTTAVVFLALGAVLGITLSALVALVIVHSYQRDGS